MAAVTSATKLSSQTELVPSERIRQFVYEYNYAPLTALAVAAVEPMGQGQGGTVAIPRWAVVSVPAGTKTETDEFSIAEVTTDETTISPAYVGLYIHVSDELQNRRMGNAMAASTAQSIRAVENRVDSDGLGLFTSCSNTESFTGLAFTEERFSTAAATFMALNPVGDRFACVMSHGMFRDFKNSIKNNGGAAFGNDVLASQIAAMVGPKAGFKGTWDGFEIYVSSNVPTTSADSNGAMLVAGDMGPLIIVSEEPIGVETERFPKRKGTEATIAASYAWGLGKQDLILEIVALS